MAAKRKKKKKPANTQARKAGGQNKPQSNKNLSGTPTPTYLESGKKAGLLLLAGIGGAIAGAAFGKLSLVLALPTVFVGTHNNNPYLTAAGIGMAVSNVPQGATSNTTNGLEGFGKLPDEINGRVKYYFQNFKEKLFLPSANEKAVAGLGEEQVTTTPYFINPYNGGMGELEFPELDRIQNQVAQMNGTLPGFEYETDREF